MDELHSELEALERAGWESLSRGTGDDFYARIMAHDGLMVLADGVVMGREEVVAALREAPPWTTYELRDMRALRLTEGSAALVYVASARRGDRPPFVAAMTSVYVHTLNGWRLVLYTQTPVASQA
jgi:hypothetical protein